ncbi:MAG TPA: HAD-IA family hydrolase, partial [Microlunatus sp.]
ATYLQDWNAGVRYLDGIDDLLDQLSRRHRLAVVSNTHHLDLVPDHLKAMGVAQYFETIVLSIEVGHRKPHPAIYQAALDRLVVPATDTLFIGDTYLADYAGPRRQGIPSLLIDPARSQDVVDHDRLDSVLDLADRLGQLRP